MTLREKLTNILEANIDLASSKSKSKMRDLADIIYQFYLDNDMVDKTDAMYYYGESENDYELHQEKDVKENIYTDIEFASVDFEMTDSDSEVELIDFMMEILTDTLAQYKFFLN